jgi:hypothetical protein
LALRDLIEKWVEEHSETRKKAATGEEEGKKESNGAAFEIDDVD